MSFQFRSRNHDMGAYFPTQQERMNTMHANQSSCAAPNLRPQAKANMTPHIPTNEEIVATMAQVEQEAAIRSEELLQVHSGLNEQRVARLLGLLD